MRDLGSLQWHAIVHFLVDHSGNEKRILRLGGARYARPDELVIQASGSLPGTEFSNEGAFFGAMTDDNSQTAAPALGHHIAVAQRQFPTSLSIPRNRIARIILR
jgi:hypothetical protein